MESTPLQAAASSSSSSAGAALISTAAMELEQVRRKGGSGESFPPTCRRLVRSLPGNNLCADCARPNPDWASISFGTLICLNCSGRHRSYGVNTSVVRSLDLDAWTHPQILSMLEGGNGQVESFLDRHRLGRLSEKANTRYHTKAARFYKKHLRQHVELITESGLYQGREVSRRLYQQHQRTQQKLLLQQQPSQSPEQPPQAEEQAPAPSEGKTSDTRVHRQASSLRPISVQ